MEKKWALICPGGTWDRCQIQKEVIHRGLGQYLRIHRVLQQKEETELTDKFMHSFICILFLSLSGMWHKRSRRKQLALQVIQTWELGCLFGALGKSLSKYGKLVFPEQRRCKTLRDEGSSNPVPEGFLSSSYEAWLHSVSFFTFHKILVSLLLSSLVPVTATWPTPGHPSHFSIASSMRDISLPSSFSFSL